jgi:hypothetical protein
MLSDIIADDMAKQTRANSIAAKMKALTQHSNAGRITKLDYIRQVDGLWRQAEDAGLEEYVDAALGNFER